MTGLNVDNRTIFCHDNLDVLQGINSNCIDLIYLDPPFNKNRKFTSPVGSSAKGAGFDDIFREEDVKDEWLQTIKEDQPELYTYLEAVKVVGRPYNFAYLAYMAIRLIECRRVLKPTGSIYLHCDPTMSHYIKLLMDSLFDVRCFQNEVVWCYGGRGMSRKRFQSKHDIILFYGRESAPFFNQEGASRPVAPEHVGRYNKIDRGGRRYARIKNRDGSYSDIYLKDVVREDWWDIPFARGKEYKGWPTQKPLALLERIIKASSNEGDMVLDPFCGCATTCVAAEHLGRKWIGIDTSKEAYDLVKERLIEAAADPTDILKYKNEIIFKTDPPERTDQDEDHREQKWVYVISNPSYPGEYKVGIARDTKARLNQYQTSDPARAYKIEFQHQTPAFRETEAHIHAQFDNKHEWVTGNLEAIINAIKTFEP